jgi:hypothetical protein
MTRESVIEKKSEVESSGTKDVRDRKSEAGAPTASETGIDPSAAHATESMAAATAVQKAPVKGDAPAAKPSPVARPSSAPKPQPPAEPFVAKPSLPVSMLSAPDGATRRGETAPKSLFPGELEDDFVTILGRVKAAPHRRPLLVTLVSLLRALIFGRANAIEESFHAERTVAFDGFRTDLHDEKLERDRRYGTVYSVAEESNAFLVRLELPRRVPGSSLKNTWKVHDEMPNYDYTLALYDDVLEVRAGLPDEALRRLSYVSSSFPTQFLTRIEFPKPTDSFKHRMRDKVLEVIIFKREG